MDDGNHQNTGSTQKKGPVCTQETPIRSEIGSPISRNVGNTQAICLTNCSAPPNELRNLRNTCYYAIKKYRKYLDKMQEWDKKIEQARDNYDKMMANTPQYGESLFYSGMLFAHNAHPETYLSPADQSSFSYDHKDFESATDDMRSSCPAAVELKNKNLKKIFHKTYNFNKNPNTKDKEEVLYGKIDISGNKKAIYLKIDAGILKWKYGNPNGINGEINVFSLSSDSHGALNNGSDFKSTNSASLVNFTAKNGTRAGLSASIMEGHFNHEVVETPGVKGLDVNKGVSAFNLNGWFAVKYSQSTTIKLGTDVSYGGLGYDYGSLAYNKHGIRAQSGHVGGNFLLGGSLSGGKTTFDDAAIIRDFEGNFGPVPK